MRKRLLKDYYRALMAEGAQQKTRVLSMTTLYDKPTRRQMTHQSTLVMNPPSALLQSHREKPQVTTIMTEDDPGTPKFDKKEKPIKIKHSDNVPAPPGKGTKKQQETTMMMLKDKNAHKDKNEEKNVRTIAHKTPETSMPLVPQQLNLNQAIKSLIYNTYTILEKELITRRIADVNKLTTKIIVMCNYCQKTKSVYNCNTCNEQFCEKCFKDVHNKVNIKQHDVVTLEQFALEKREKSPWPEKIESLGYLLSKSSSSSEVGYWRKFEYFNFPITKSANHFQTMKVAFNMLYTLYITNNGITKDNEVESLEKALKFTKKGEASPEKRPLITRDNNAKELEGDLDLSYEQTLEQFIGLGMFNVEEKFFMNRVAFLNFKRRGAKATFDEFIKKLKILEEGSFESKLFLAFDLIDQDDNGVISRSEFVSILQYAFMQNMISGNNIDEVLNELFKSGIKVNKKDVFQIVLKSKKLQSLFAAYTQTTSKQVLDDL